MDRPPDDARQLRDRGESGVVRHGPAAVRLPRRTRRTRLDSPLPRDATHTPGGDLPPDSSSRNHGSPPRSRSRTIRSRARREVSLCRPRGTTGLPGHAAACCTTSSFRLPRHVTESVPTTAADAFDVSPLRASCASSRCRAIATTISASQDGKKRPSGPLQVARKSRSARRTAADKAEARTLALHGSPGRASPAITPMTVK